VGDFGTSNSSDDRELPQVKKKDLINAATERKKLCLDAFTTFFTQKMDTSQTGHGISPSE